MLRKVDLKNFRSYERGEFEFDKVTVVVGGNGAGKSNLVEAIYLLATGKSFRADREAEMIMRGKDNFNVEGELEGGDRLRVFLGEVKRYEVNGVPKRQMDFVGRIRAVLFSPTDMDLVSGSPSVRRKYLDFVISQADREYRRSLISYEKGLRQRNRLLLAIREGVGSRSQLFFWDKLLIKNGEYLTGKREEFLELAGFEYDKSIISEGRLKQYEVEEVAAATTLVGPHRDDFVMVSSGQDVAKYGSRGEQRMSVWWVKQKEIDYLTSMTGGSERPVLLLDDIFSELDHKHRDEVAEYVMSYEGQVLMTTADEHLVPRINGAKIIQL